MMLLTLATILAIAGPIVGGIGAVRMMQRGVRGRFIALYVALVTLITSFVVLVGLFPQHPLLWLLALATGAVIFLSFGMYWPLIRLGMRARGIEVNTW